MNNNKIFERFINTSYRKTILILMMSVIMLMSVFFAFINFFISSTEFAIPLGFVMSIVGVMTGIGLTLTVYRNFEDPYFQAFYVFFVLIILVLLAIVFSFPFETGLHFWAVTIPIGTYIIFGKRYGFLISLASILIAGIVFYKTHYKNFNDINVYMMLNLFFMYNIIWFFSHLYETVNYSAKLSMAEHISSDSLTALLNRRALRMCFDMHKHESFGLVIFDLDFFKRINDRYGHEAGDTVLKYFANELYDFFEKKAYISRLGGEEFCVFMPTDHIAEVIAEVEEFHSKIVSYSITVEHTSDSIVSSQEVKLESISIKFSAGIAMYKPHDDEMTTLEHVLKKADKKLYKAKSQGRNTIIA